MMLTRFGPCLLLVSPLRRHHHLRCYLQVSTLQPLVRILLFVSSS
jgi:hypothetical protein